MIRLSASIACFFTLLATLVLAVQPAVADQTRDDIAQAIDLLRNHDAIIAVGQDAPDSLKQAAEALAKTTGHPLAQDTFFIRQGKRTWAFNGWYSGKTLVAIGTPQDNTVVAEWFHTDRNQPVSHWQKLTPDLAADEPAVPTAQIRFFQANKLNDMPWLVSPSLFIGGSDSDAVTSRVEMLRKRFGEPVKTPALDAWYEHVMVATRTDESSRAQGRHSTKQAAARNEKLWVKINIRSSSDLDNAVLEQTTWQGPGQLPPLQVYALARRGAGWMRKTPEQRETIMRLCEARCVQIGLGDHAIDHFITPADYEAHPSWRGMRDGQRVVKCTVVIPEAMHLNAQLPIQPCFANEELCEELTDRIQAHMAEFPSIELYAMWPHDGVNNWCQCEKCAATAPHAMMHKLAVMLERKLPTNVMIETIAYSNLLTIPGKPLEKVSRTFSLFCPYLRHYENAIYSPGYDGPCSVGVNYPEPDRINTVDEREYGPLFEKWVAIWKQAGVGPGVFEYTGNFPDETFRTTRTRYGYHPSVQLIAQEIDWYLSHDVQVYYLCGAVRCWPDALDELALAHALWRGSDGLQEAIDRYYHAIAGRQGKALRAALLAVSDKLDAHQTPVDQVAHAQTLLGDVKSDDQRQLYAMWLEYVLLTRKACHAIEQGELQQAIEAEKTLQEWIDTHHARIGWSGRLSRLRSLSAISQQRLEERLHQKTGTKYVL